jgi:hypothetical protein
VSASDAYEDGQRVIVNGWICLIEVDEEEEERKDRGVD